jgi:hypothetical protein
MEFKNVNPNGDNIIASNVNFFIFENCENSVQK